MMRVPRSARPSTMFVKVPREGGYGGEFEQPVEVRRVRFEPVSAWLVREYALGDGAQGLVIADGADSPGMFEVDERGEVHAPPRVRHPSPPLGTGGEVAMPAAVTVDLTKLMKRFSAKELEAKQVKFAMSVAEDMNAFTPEDTKRMHNSMQAASDFRQGLVIWDADYAAYVRDLPDSSIKHGKNPRAKADWPKAAKEAHGEDWERLAVDLLTEGA